MIEVKETADGLAFGIYVQPRSAKIAIVGPHQQALKIKLTAPPVGGAANKQCIELLAKAMAVPKSTIAIIKGQSSRRKRVLIKSATGTFGRKEIRTLKNRLQHLSSAKS